MLFWTIVASLTVVVIAVGVLAFLGWKALLVFVALILAYARARDEDRPFWKRVIETGNQTSWRENQDHAPPLRCGSLRHKFPALPERTGAP